MCSCRSKTTRSWQSASVKWAKSKTSIHLSSTSKRRHAYGSAKEKKRFANSCESYSASTIWSPMRNGTTQSTYSERKKPGLTMPKLWWVKTLNQWKHKEIRGWLRSSCSKDLSFGLWRNYTRLTGSQTCSNVRKTNFFTSTASIFMTFYASLIKISKNSRKTCCTRAPNRLRWSRSRRHRNLDPKSKSKSRAHWVKWTRLNNRKARKTTTCQGVVCACWTRCPSKSLGFRPSTIPIVRSSTDGPSQRLR